MDDYCKKMKGQNKLSTEHHVKKQHEFVIISFCVAVFLILVGQNWPSLPFLGGYLGTQQWILLLMTPFLLVSKG